LSVEQFEAVSSYLESIATLKNCSLSPGPAGASVGTAHKLVSDAIVHTPRRTKGKTGAGAR
jgi:hypothetical protein